MSEKAEIERKFLVRNLPSLDGVRSAEIVQGYLAVEPEGAEVRIRKSGDHHYETVKTGAGLRRVELEIEITPGQFNALWPATQNRRIEKVRYEIPYQGRRIELDVYRDRLAGLQVAEVEFETEPDSAAFAPPDWFGEEITEIGAYKNHSLAVHGLPKVKQ